MKTEQEILDTYLKNAEGYLNHCKLVDITFNHLPVEERQEVVHEFVLKFKDYLKLDDHGKPELHYAPVTRVAYEAMAGQQFCSVRTLKEAWETDGLYKVTTITRTDELDDLEKDLAKNKISKEDKLKQIFIELNALSSATVGTPSHNKFKALKDKYPIYWKYLDLLGYDEIAKCGWNKRLLKKKFDRRKEQIIMNNPRFLKSIRENLEINALYTRPQLKAVFSDIYSKYGVQATATGENISYFCSYIKVDRDKKTGRQINAFKITGYNSVINWDDITPNATNSDRQEQIKAGVL